MLQRPFAALAIAAAVLAAAVTSGVSAGATTSGRATPAPLSASAQARAWNLEAGRPRADVLLHGWRFAPAETIVAEVPSPRVCEPRWVAPRATDLDLAVPARHFRSVQGPDISACAAKAMSVSYSAGIDTPYGEGQVDFARMRWDRPAFPVDASVDRIRAARIAGYPAAVVEPLHLASGFGPSHLILITRSSFEPYAELLVLNGMHVALPTLVDLAEQIVLGRPTAAASLPDLLDQEPTDAQIKMLPPAAHGDGKVRAKLTDDWHCSRVSGDSCPKGRTHKCVPGSFGHSSCSALDWNRGSPAIGENIYFRALGSASPSAHVVDARPSSYMQTCHVVQVQVVDDGRAIGSMRYQHITRLAKPFEVRLGAEVESLTERLIGETLNEARLAPGCPWSGSHVHEDDTTAKAWKSWNEDRYDNRDRSRFDVRSKANWTRMLRWTRPR